MSKAQCGGKQRNITAILQNAVFSVSHKRKAVVGELAAYLMGASCQKLHPHKAQAISLCKPPVVQPCLLYTFCHAVCHIAFAFSLVAAHKVSKVALLRRYAMRNRQIFLVKAVLPYLSGELRGAFGIPRKEHQATHHSVQTMDSAHILTVASQFLSYKLRKPTGLICGQNSGRLYADYNLFIQIQYFHRNLVKTPQHNGWGVILLSAAYQPMRSVPLFFLGMRATAPAAEMSMSIIHAPILLLSPVAGA